MAKSARPVTQDHRPKKKHIVEYMVAATIGEYQLLWEKYHERLDSWERVVVVDGKLLPSQETVGKVARHPVNVDFRWVRISGHLIGFYHACSRVVDHDMVEKWVDLYLTPPNVSGEEKGRRTADFGHALADLHIELKPVV